MRQPMMAFQKTCHGLFHWIIGFIGHRMGCTMGCGHPWDYMGFAMENPYWLNGDLWDIAMRDVRIPETSKHCGWYWVCVGCTKASLGRSSLQIEKI